MFFSKEFELNAYDDNNIFFKLCKHVINDDKIYEYFLDWLAFIIQTPWKKTNVAIIFYSETKGVGKDSIICLLKKLFSKYYAQLESIEDIAKNFNKHLCNKLLIYGEETSSRAKQNNDKLKALITKTTINMESKGHDTIILDDFANYIFSTNNESCFKVEEGDRRLLFINCIEKKLINSNINPKSYYKYIEKQENIDNIYSFLKNRKITNNIGVEPPPMTKYKQELLFENKPGYIQYLYKSNPHEFIGLQYTGMELYEKAIEFCKKHYLSTSFTSQKFGKTMKDVLSEFYKRSNGSKFDFRTADINKFNKLLYDYDKDYYKYINQVESFEEIDCESDDESINNNNLD